MFNKIYDFFTDLLKKNYKTIIGLLIFAIIINFPLPYYIFTNGGISDLSSKFEIENSSVQKGSYNLSYVTELNGNVFTVLGSFFMPNWDLVELGNYQVSSSESLEELETRDRLSLQMANQTAVMLAYYKASKTVNIKDTNFYVYYTDDSIISSSKIYVGDIIETIDGNTFESLDEFSKIIGSKSSGEEISLGIKRKNDNLDIKVKVQEIQGRKILGIAIYSIYDYEVSPKITFKFKANESGSSAGFMTTLAIYDSLIEEDLTHGLKIAGTGTIDSLGNVGEIGGVKYKLKGAVSSKADIFFVPLGENYDECMKIQKEKNYDIEIVPISTLDEAIDYLNNIKI